MPHFLIRKRIKKMADSEQFKGAIPGAKKNLEKTFESGHDYGEDVRRFFGIKGSPQAASPSPSPDAINKAIEKRKQTYGQ